MTTKLNTETNTRGAPAPRRPDGLTPHTHKVFGATFHGSGARHLRPLNTAPESLLTTIDFRFGLDGPAVRAVYELLLMALHNEVRKPDAYRSVIQSVFYAVGKAHAETLTHGRRCVVGYYRHSGYYSKHQGVPGHRVVAATMKFLSRLKLISINPSPGHIRISYFEPTRLFPMGVKLEPIVKESAGAVLVYTAKEKTTGATTRSARRGSGRRLLRDGELQAGDLAVVQRVRQELTRINNHAMRFTYHLCDLDDVWYEVFRGQVIHKAVFNNSSTVCGGRNYCGFQSQPQREFHVRETLLIDGRRCIELDFCNLHIRMLYHLRGLTYEGDCYDIEIPGWDADPDVKRALIKLLLLALPNCGKLGKSARANRHAAIKTAEKQMAAFRDRPNPHPWPGDLVQDDEVDEAESEAAMGRWLRHTLPYDITPTFVVECIAKAHPAIADDLYTGAGIRLQAIDGELARSIMLRFVDLGRPCIGCHDSFQVWEEDEGQLRQIMEEEYIKIKQLNGFAPKIEKKDKKRKNLPQFKEE